MNRWAIFGMSLPGQEHEPPILTLFAEVNQRLVVVPGRLKPSAAFDVGEPMGM